MIEDINKKLRDNVEDTSLATVAKTGSYKDLAYKPVIPKVPRKVSSFQNDSEYLTQEDISGKADKATTYTKTEVDSIVTNIKNSRFESVNTLPTTNIKILPVITCIIKPTIYCCMLRRPRKAR